MRNYLRSISWSAINTNRSSSRLYGFPIHVILYEYQNEMYFFTLKPQTEVFFRGSTRGGSISHLLYSLCLDLQIFYVDKLMCRIGKVWIVGTVRVVVLRTSAASIGTYKIQPGRQNDNSLSGAADNIEGINQCSAAVSAPASVEYTGRAFPISSLPRPRYVINTIAAPFCV